MQSVVSQLEVTADEQTQTTEQALLDAQIARMVHATRDELLQVEREVTLAALEAAADLSSPAVAIQFGSRTIMAQQIDNKRLIQSMAPHICFN